MQIPCKAHSYNKFLVKRIQNFSCKFPGDNSTLLILIEYLLSKNFWTMLQTRDPDYLIKIKDGELEFEEIKVDHVVTKG